MPSPSPPRIRTLLASFSLPLYPSQISRWRGAFVEMVSREQDLLHNHRSEGGIYYRYPLIQYRSRQGKAAIFAINEGTEALQLALSTNAWELTWNRRARMLQLEGLQLKEYDLAILPAPKTYHLHRWVALNEENYRLWQAQPHLSDRIQLLERILVGHILKFATAMDWQIPKGAVGVRLLNIRKEGHVKVHGNHLLAFDVVYQSNVFLPPLISLGKASSLGYGWQIPGRSTVRESAE